MFVYILKNVYNGGLSLSGSGDNLQRMEVCNLVKIKPVTGA